MIFRSSGGTRGTPKDRSQALTAPSVTSSRRDQVDALDHRVTNFLTSNATDVVVGVDTHSDVHVAVAIDEVGRRFGELAVPTNLAGSQRLEDWAIGFRLESFDLAVLPAAVWLDVLLELYQNLLSQLAHVPRWRASLDGGLRIRGRPERVSSVQQT